MSTMAVSTEKIEKAATDAKDKLTALNIEEKLVAELEWCLGSFASDGNSSGLVEKGSEALKALKKFKESNPRKVSKKLIDDLGKAFS